VPYTPQTWVDGSGGGTPITAARLNTMENGLEDADVRINALDGISTIGNIGASQTLTAGGENGTAKLVTLTAATCTLTFGVGGNGGEIRTLELVITQDATGSRTITWPASVKWASGTPPVLSTVGGSIDRVVCTTYNGGTTWYCDLIGKAYA
jgi:hypothetical protein